jgi:branched-chain amino acid transport system substrate-binding protein
MRILLKNFIILLSVTLLSSCQSFNKDLIFKVESNNSSQTSTHKYYQNNLETRDLETLNYNKKKVKIALFLPFSGKNKDLGWHLFNAASMSLFDNDSDNNIELVLIDSKDNPADTAKSFKEIVDRGIKVVIGPVFSQSVRSIEKDVKENDITAISFSNNRELINKTTEKSGIFLAGLLPESEIDKITTYSLEHGKLNFAIIAPNTKYGITITKLLKTMVKTKDGNFIISELYQPNNRSMEEAVSRAVTSFSIDSKLSEGGGNKIAKDTSITDSDRSYPQVIMVPESGKNLSKIVAAIKKYNLEERTFQIIGTSQWDDISTLNDPNLAGAWFAAPENEKFRKFEGSYYQLFNKFPPRIAAIAYDSVAAISKLVESKKGQDVTFTDFASYSNSPTSNSENGFEGIDGLFRFLPNGLVQRNLAVLKVGNGKFETIEKPAEKLLKY